MRPAPIAPILIRLLGADAPKMLCGTIAGKPLQTIAEVMVALTVVSMNLRRESSGL